MHSACLNKVHFLEIQFWLSLLHPFVFKVIVLFIPNFLRHEFAGYIVNLMVVF